MVMKYEGTGDLPILTLTRKYLEDRTIGSLSNGMKTLELPWRNNEVDVSCITPYMYLVLPDDTGRFRWFSVKDVDGRTFIELHEGRIPTNSNGCILVGSRLNSRGDLFDCYEALTQLRKDYPDGFWLDIREYEDGDVW